MALCPQPASNRQPGRDRPDVASRRAARQLPPDPRGRRRRAARTPGSRHRGRRSALRRQRSASRGVRHRSRRTPRSRPRPSRSASPRRRHRRECGPPGSLDAARARRALKRWPGRCRWFRRARARSGVDGRRCSRCDPVRRWRSVQIETTGLVTHPAAGGIDRSADLQPFVESGVPGADDLRCRCRGPWPDSDAHRRRAPSGRVRRRSRPARQPRQEGRASASTLASEN